MSREKDLITAQTLAKALNLSVETIWRYTREKKIPYLELGSKQYRYRLADAVDALSSGRVQEKKAAYDDKTVKKYTYQDYLELPEEEGFHYEILDGELIKEAAPNVVHQRVSRRLQRMLEDYFWEVDPEGEVFDAPLDVTIFETNVVQPDLLYIAGKEKDIVEYARVDGPPTLVVEILSPSTQRKDRVKKMQLYQKVSVQHYWLVDPDNKLLECFALRDSLYTLVASGMDEDIVKHPSFAGLSVDLAALFK